MLGNNYKKTIYLIVAFSFIIAAAAYPVLPDTIASHWNIRGEVDGFLPKLIGVSLMPVISLFMLLFYFSFSTKDPKARNNPDFLLLLDRFLLLIISFLFYLYLLTLIWNTGLYFNIIKFISPAFALLFFLLGHILQTAKPNYFIGFRTPWSLDNKNNWEKIHSLGSVLFKISGLSLLLGLLKPEYFFMTMLATLTPSVLLIYLYSYFIYIKRSAV